MEVHGGVTMSLSVDSISPGDKVEQIGPAGLLPVHRVGYAVEVGGGELTLSQTPNDQPVTDLKGRPRHFPLLKFRKVTWDT